MAMEPAVRLAVRRRSYWLTRNTEEARKYVYLNKAERAKIDRLFEQKKGPAEVNKLVDRLDDKRRERNRVSSLRTRALKSMRRLDVRPKYHDSRVADNNKKMSPAELQLAAASTVDELMDLARPQYEGNLFFYH